MTRAEAEPARLVYDPATRAGRRHGPFKLDTRH